MEHDGGLALLQDVLRRQVLSLVEELCRRHLPPGQRAGELFLSGNTVLQHIACGLSPGSIAKAPFAPSTLFWQEAPLEWEGLAVRLSPCVAGYVGGDITAGLLSCGRLLEGRSLFVDVGTNGEMALRCGDGFLCCAVATGPAYEGGGISCGMAGLPGAVRRMSWDGAGPVLEVIGGGQPRGLCGSGLLDALALLLELGAVDQSGRLLPPDEAAALENRADVLVSLGNTYDNQMPSKLFSYLGTGKPLLHLAVTDTDPPLPYLAKYPLALVLHKKNGVTPEVVDTLRRWLTDVQGQCLPYAQVTALYPEFTPGVVAQTFIGRI